PPALPPFPTRRSSDLEVAGPGRGHAAARGGDRERVGRRRVRLAAAAHLPGEREAGAGGQRLAGRQRERVRDGRRGAAVALQDLRSEEHTSELQSLAYL